MIDVSGDFGNIRFYTWKINIVLITYDTRLVFTAICRVQIAVCRMRYPLDSTMMTSDSPRRNLLAASNIT